MEKEKIVSAFDAFVDERYADSEEILRTELKQAVNDFLKNKLELSKDPIQSPSSNDDTVTDDESTKDTEE